MNHYKSKLIKLKLNWGKFHQSRNRKIPQ